MSNLHLIIKIKNFLESANMKTMLILKRDNNNAALLNPEKYFNKIVDFYFLMLYIISVLTC